MGDGGRGREGSWPYRVQRLRMKSDVGQETGGKPQKNSKRLEKKGRKMLLPAQGTDLRLTSALLPPTRAALTQDSHSEAGPWGCSPSSQVRSGGLYWSAKSVKGEVLLH